MMFDDGQRAFIQIDFKINFRIQIVPLLQGLLESEFIISEICDDVILNNNNNKLKNNFKGSKQLSLPNTGNYQRFGGLFQDERWSQ